MTPDPQNGTGKLLSTLAASGDKAIQFGILVLVGLSGLGNWLSTNQNATQTRGEVNVAREQAYKQIRELHDALGDFQKRQQQMLDDQNRILSEIRNAAPMNRNPNHDK